jgi:hypothetical protein
VIEKIQANKPEMTVLGLLRPLSGGRGHPEVMGTVEAVAK